MYIHTDNLDYPTTRQVDSRNREMVRPFVIRSGSLAKILMPGFRCNGGSVPRFAWWFQSPWTGNGVPGFWGHDADYGAKKGTKLKRDWDLLVMHKQYNVSFLRRWIIFVILLLFGWPAWRKSNGDIDYVLYFDADDEDGIEAALCRGQVMAQLMAKQRDTFDAETTEIIKQRIASVERGDIDEFLKQRQKGQKNGTG